MPPTYLTAAYKDRERVKGLGARWDPNRRQWYVPDGQSLVPFETWLPAAVSTALDLTPDAPLQTPGQVTAVRTGVALSQLLAGVAQAIAQAHRTGVWTTVEVVKADLRRGHVYLEVAERSPGGELMAQSRAMIWADTANEIVPAFKLATGVVLGAGIKLLVRAKPVMHALYGISLVVDQIDPEYTLGDLEARKREIRVRLQREGLFDLNRGLDAPWDFNAVLVVAPQGAAGLGDFQAEAQRLERFGICRFVYAFSRFQGEGAPAEMRRTLLEAMDAWSMPNHRMPDAVVIIRGGGAVNDLAWLNDYDLARAICELAVPVFTGIGHERDSTLLDEVAHTRFDTPSKAIGGIEQVIARRAGDIQANHELILRIAQQHVQRARRAVEQNDGLVRAAGRQHLSTARRRTEAAVHQLRHDGASAIKAARALSTTGFAVVQQRSQSQLASARSTIPALAAEVRSESRRAVRQARMAARVDLAAIQERSMAAAARARERQDLAMQDASRNARRLVVDARTLAEAAMREVVGQGPAKTLGRGFAIVHDRGGATITSAVAAAAASELSIEFRDGRVAARTQPEVKDKDPAP